MKFIDSFDESMNKKKEIERISQNLTICLTITKGTYGKNHVGNWHSPVLLEPKGTQRFCVPLFENGAYQTDFMPRCISVAQGQFRGRTVIGQRDGAEYFFCDSEVRITVGHQHLQQGDSARN